MILEVNALERRRVECKGERVKVCEGKAGEVEKKGQREVMRKCPAVGPHEEYSTANVVDARSMQQWRVCRRGA